MCPCLVESTFLVCKACTSISKRVRWFKVLSPAPPFLVHAASGRKDVAPRCAQSCKLTRFMWFVAFCKIWWRPWPCSSTVGGWGGRDGVNRMEFNSMRSGPDFFNHLGLLVSRGCVCSTVELLRVGPATLATSDLGATVLMALAEVGFRL